MTTHYCESLATWARSEKVDDDAPPLADYHRMDDETYAEVLHEWERYWDRKRCGRVARLFVDYTEDPSYEGTKGGIWLCAEHYDALMVTWAEEGGGECVDEDGECIIQE